jgi:hypothetical protein
MPTEFSPVSTDKRRNFNLRPRPVVTFNEPIEVHIYSETEDTVEPMPAATPPPVIESSISDRIVPRPEAGTEPTPFMPYADEASELARLLHPGQDRLAAQQTAEPPLIRPLRGFAETAEPPMNMPAPTWWRSHGKLPCSVR